MENTQKIIDEALDLINKEDFMGAQALLKQAVSLDDKNIEAYKNLGLCEVNLDNPIAAIEAFLKAIELDDNDATSMFYLASCYNRTGEKELAVEKFEEVLKLRPDYVEVYKSLAMNYIEFGQVDEAIKLLNNAINNPQIPADYSLYYIFATCYMLKKDYKEASKNLELALSLNPEHLPIMNSLSSAYMSEGEYDKALDILHKAYELDKDNSLTSYNLGVCNQVLGRYNEALEYFKVSYQLEPSVTMLASLANCALKAQEYSLASSLYQNLVATYPNNMDYRISYIEALEMTDQNKDALENVNLLLALDEKNIPLTKKKGTLLRKMGQYQDSIDTFEILLNRGKIDVEVYYNLAFNYVELGDFDNAKEMFKKCIMLEPENPYAHKDLGVLYLKMNCYEWAVEEMIDAINLEPNVAEFHYSLGVSYMMLSQIDEAKESLLKAIDLEPNNPDALAYLGYVYIVEKDDKKAQFVLQKALAIDPNNFLAKTHMAKLYFQQRKYDTAKQFLMDIIETIQDDETMNMLGICYLETQEYNEAMGIFYKLALNYPKNHILLTNLAKCELKCGRKKEALDHIRQALLVFDDYSDALNLLEEVNSGK